MTPKVQAALLVALVAVTVTCTTGRPASQSNASADARGSVAVGIDAEAAASPRACATYSAARADGRVSDTRLAELSGIAVSRRVPGLIWANNDSGDQPVLYAMRGDGAALGTIRIAGATAYDWEDLAIGPCGPRVDAADCLYIGDIGDNQGTRTEAVVYRIKEPPIRSLEPFGDLIIYEFERFAFTYPRGPRNAEGLAVAPDGSVYVFTKDEGTADLFVFPALLPDERPHLDYLGSVKIGTGRGAKVTAFDIHPDGRRVLVRTYYNALEWRIPAGEPIAWITGKPGTPVPTVIEPQGEAIAYDPLRGGYIHVSEGVSPQIFRVTCDDPPTRP